MKHATVGLCVGVQTLQKLRSAFRALRADVKVYASTPQQHRTLDFSICAGLQTSLIYERYMAMWQLRFAALTGC